MSSPKAAKRAGGRTAARPATKSPARSAAKPATKGAKAGADPATKNSAKRVAKTSASNALKNSEAAQELARDLEAALRDGEAELLAPEAVQALMAALLKTYTAQVQTGYFPPLASVMSVTPTDVMVTASALLKAADLQVFELGMWQSWTGR